MKIDDYCEKIQACSLFQNIENPTELIQQVHYRIRTYHDEQVVAYQGDRCDELLILTEGKISAEISNLKGNVVKIADISAPSSLATAFLFGKKQIFPVNAIARSQVKVLRFAKTSVMKMFELDKAFLLNYINQVSTRAQFLTDRLKFVSFNTIKGKLAYYLLNLEAEQKSETLELQQTQNEIAELFGVTRPSLARCFRQLADENCIRTERKKVHILNHKKLGSYLQYEDHLH